MNAGSFAPALVLNADFRPLNYFPLSLWSWQDTIKAVCLDRVTIISEYDQKDLVAKHGDEPAIGYCAKGICAAKAQPCLYPF